MIKFYAIVNYYSAGNNFVEYKENVEIFEIKKCKLFFLINNKL